MGTYLNPGNSGFRRIINSNYVDKTGIIGLLNNAIDTTGNLICVSRPRRFGKSFAAQMLCAYYGKTYDSHGLFKDYEISRDDSYETYLNKYDVIYIDMTYVKQFCDDYREVAEYLSAKITEELVSEYPDITPSNEFPATLMNASL